MTKIYEIPESRVPGLQYRVNKLAARAAKHGLFQPDFKVVGAFTKTIEVYDPLARIRGHETDVKEMGISISQVEAGGIDPQLGEWKMVGFRYGRREDGQDLASLNWGEVPEHKRDQPLCCDHCGLKRRRSETLIVCREADGAIVEVGTSCLSDFTGHDYSDSFLKSLSDAGRLMTAIEEAANWSLHDAEFTLQDEIRNVLAVAASIVRVDGFLNAKAAEELGGASTARQVADELSRLNGKNVDTSTIMVTRQDFETAEQVIAECNARPFDGGFNDKVKMSIERGLASPSDIGLLAAAVGSYFRDQERKQKNAAFQPIVDNSKPFGQQGDKALIRVKVAQLKTVKSDYYPSFDVISFVDDSNNLFVWKTSSNHSFVEGHRYEIAGRVKGHSVGAFPPFKNANQTELKNVSAKDHFGPALAEADDALSKSIDDELENVLGF